MNGSFFKLASVAKPDGKAFVAIVMGDDAIDIAAAHAAYRASFRKSVLSSTDSMLGLLENWDANFVGLQEVAAFVEKEGLRHDSAKLASLHALPPVRRPGKMFYAAPA
jgi:hypothetical protein